MGMFDDNMDYGGHNYLRVAGDYFLLINSVEYDDMYFPKYNIEAEVATGPHKGELVQGTITRPTEKYMKDNDRAIGGDLGGGSESLIANQSVRKLTPLECERLQGYPDGWTALDHEDKAVSDTQRYKALGNSFAVPNALFVISRCVKQLQTGGTERKEREMEK